jgi:hypothetical protein
MQNIGRRFADYSPSPGNLLNFGLFLLTCKPNRVGESYTSKARRFVILETSE